MVEKLCLRQTLPMSQAVYQVGKKQMSADFVAIINQSSDMLYFCVKDASVDAKVLAFQLQVASPLVSPIIFRVLQLFAAFNKKGRFFS